ncbi:MAG: hypothetical protein O2894_09665, partial [Planctomycetota bacterium]|nr:hypothetical protein [Planctomycetota bacterium]
MIVLGLHAFGHDAAAVLVADGMTLFASSQERFDRQRHSPAFPGAAIAAALATAGLQPEDVDAVAFPWTRSMGRPQKLAHVLRHLPRSRAFFREPADTVVADRRAYLHSMRGLEAQLRSQGFTAPVHRVPHHQAHAAAAALLLPGGDGAVLTADGMGEWTTAATWHARAHTLQRRARAVYPHSPGKAYAAVTQWLGFVPESDEGKTMGLAAYGDPASPGAAFARSLLRPHGRTLLRVDKGAFGFPWGEAQLYGARFLEALGPAGTGLGPERAGDADVARGIQDAVEAFARAAAEQVLARAEQPTLGLA